VAALFPLTFEERDALRLPDMSGNPRFEDVSSLGTPELFERWHQWLWLDEQGMPQADVEALGASAIFAEACTRLGDVLSGVLYNAAEP
jgi:hypothetical protein